MDPPSRARELVLLDVGGESLVLAPGDGFVRRLDPLRTLVLELCDGQASAETIAGEIAEATGQDAGSLLAPLHGLLADLTDQGLLAVVGQGEPPPPHAPQVAPGCT